MISTVVLSYKRREALARVLESVFDQDYPDREVIVVDNGSGHDMVTWLRAAYPRARVIALGENKGPAARNLGIRAARGRYIVTLDNDVYFDDSQALNRIAAAFERHPGAGCIVFRVYHPATGRLHVRDWCHPRPWQQAESQEFETFYITEGAAAFRREVFDKVQPYWPELFIGHEGFDLAVRLMDAGYEIWYVPDVKVWHLASRETRPDWRPFYYYARNLFPIVYRNYPLPAGIAHLAPRLAVFGLYALRAGAFGKYLRGVADGLRMWPACRDLRKPVGRQTLERMRRLRRYQPGLLRRFVLGAQRMIAGNVGPRPAMERNDG